MCWDVASMRPPLNAGENPAGCECPERYSKASMRPPLNAGENQDDLLDAVIRLAASMRPPLNAGENPGRSWRWPTRPRRFNEAPAERGGKPRITPGKSTIALMLQ